MLALYLSLTGLRQVGVMRHMRGSSGNIFGSLPFFRMKNWEAGPIIMNLYKVTNIPSAVSAGSMLIARCK